MSKIAVDIGGTFTDVVLLTDGGEVKTAKSFSTPHDFSEGILNGLKKLEVDLDGIDLFVHGTTIALNTLLQRKGASTGLITTAGFRDVLEIMRTNRPDMYNLQQIKPEPLIPRRFRREVRERIDAEGGVLTDLDLDELINEVSFLVQQGITSVAICFLNSYINPLHEQRAKEMIQSIFPDLSVSISAEVIQEWREFERTSTTVANSYCKPNVERYVGNLSSSLREKGLRSPIQYMQSNGGLMSEKEFVNTPVKSLLSGPVGGVSAGEYISRLLNISNLITLDIGGTSADISVISGYKATYSREKEINRLPILHPTVDVHTIGAGGGSIAWMDKGGALQVGPHSAGSYPGPISYSNGGEETTVSDANLLLGYIDPDFFLGGEITLNQQKAFEMTEKKLACHFHVSVEEIAHGIIQVINAKMSRALKEVLIKGGHDPRNFSLLAFGGGGGLHAVELARELNIPKVIVPIHPSVFSAFGMLSADIKYDISRTYMKRLKDISLPDLNDLILGLKDTVWQKIVDSSNQTIEQCSVQYDYHVQIRYIGQEYTLEIPMEEESLDVQSLDRLGELFKDKHQAYYGYHLEDEMVLTNVKVTAKNSNGQRTVQQLGPHDKDGRDARKKDRMVYLPSIREMGYVAVYDRENLLENIHLQGPCIIEDHQTTIALLGDDQATVDRYGNIHIEIGGSQHAS